MIGGDPNLRLVDGEQKRFFTRVCLEGLFASPWAIIQLEEKETTRFGAPKALWEIVATKELRGDEGTVLHGLSPIPRP